MAKYNSRDQKKRKNPTKTSKTSECYRCGKHWDKEHNKSCRAREATCNKCGLKGHFEKACRKEKSKRVNCVANEQKSVEISCDCGICGLNLNCVTNISNM